MDPDPNPSQIYTETRESGGRARALTPGSDKEGGVDGEPRLAQAASRVVVPVGGASAGEGAPGRRRCGAPGEGRRQPSPRNPQHRVVLFLFLRLLRWWRSPPIYSRLGFAPGRTTHGQGERETGGNERDGEKILGAVGYAGPISAAQFGYVGFWLYFIGPKTFA